MIIAIVEMWKNKLSTRIFRRPKIKFLEVKYSSSEALFTHECSFSLGLEVALFP